MSVECALIAPPEQDRHYWPSTYLCMQIQSISQHKVQETVNNMKPREVCLSFLAY